MAEYYLISQLPSLDGLSESTPLPITEERFLELCHRFLDKKAQSELDKLSLIPSREGEKSSSPLINSWCDGERTLRLVLAKIRAEKMKKTFDVQASENSSFSPILTQTVRSAVETDNPMEAENLLNVYRLAFLETLRPTDAFSVEYVFYYYLKLKLILRMKEFDFDSGVTAYKNIYNSIMNGDNLEAVQ